MSETRGRGRSKGSLDALARARAKRSLEARTGQPAEPEKPRKLKPHLERFHTAWHLAKMRQAKAEKRQERLGAAQTLLRAQEAAAARQEHEAALQTAQTEAERLRLVQAEQERQRQQAEERERRRTRPITILTASVWLGEDPRQTLKRWPDGSVLASDVEEVLQENAKRGVYHTPSGAWRDLKFTISDAAAILGIPAPEPPEPVTATRQIPARCPRKHDTPSVLVLEQRDAYSNQLWRCPQCEYKAVLMVWPNRGWEEPQGKLWTSTEPWTPPVTTEQYTFTPEPPLVTIDEACKLLGIELPAYEEPPFDYPQPPPSPRAGEDLRRQQTDREAHERVYAPEYHRIVSSWGAASSGGSYRSRFEYLLNHGA